MELAAAAHDAQSLLHRRNARSEAGRENCVARMVGNNEIRKRYSALSRRLIEAKDMMPV